MKKVFLGLILAIVAMAQPLPNCFLNGGLSATGTSPVLDNSLSKNQCNTWVLTVFVPSTVSAYSVQLEGSGAGTFSAVIVSPSSGTNPCTVLTGCLIIFQGNYNQFRVNLTSLTGTGIVSYRLSGASGITAKSLSPLGLAGGDLSGSYPNPTVAKVNNNTPGGACTNQFVRSLNSSAVPTCATVDNASLTSPTITVNSTACTLGSSCTVSASATPFFTQTANGTVTTSGSFQSLISTGTGSNSVTLTAGQSVHIMAGGRYTTTATPGTIQWRTMVGTNVINTSSQTLPVSQTNDGWACNVLVTFRTVGITGTMVGRGSCVFGELSSFTQSQVMTFDATGVVTGNNTGPVTIDFGIVLSANSQSVTADVLQLSPL